MRTWTRPLDPLRTTAVLALAVAVLVELLPWVGADLVAQQWWASWAASGGDQPVDLGWYAGSPAVSYSLLSPWLMSWAGPAVPGVLATVVGATATTALLRRAGAVRLVAAGATAALAFGADQLSGRTTFALGLAVGLLALCVAGRRWPPVRRTVGTAVLAAVAGGLSPVVAVFLGLAAVAWVCGSGRPLRHTADAVALTIGAGLPLAAMVGLGAAGGPMTGSAHQMAAAVLAALVVVAVLGPDQPVARVGAGLTAAGLLLAWAVPDPVGSNATRLVLLFAVPVLVGLARRDRVLVALAAALVTWLLPPLVPGDLSPRGGLDDAVARTGSAGLLAELARRGPVGRVEVVPLATHQESLLADTVPLARGWTRQLDLARNPVFYDGSLDAGSYLGWLRDRGVSWVALTDRRPDWAARREATLVRRGVPGLSPVWSDDTWTLYAVDGPGLVLAGDAVLTGSDRRSVALTAAEVGRVELSLFWSDHLDVTAGDACVAPGPTPGTVLLRVGSPGPVTLSSAWRPRGHCAG
ncbi:hypothetical protein ASG36_02615 [Geodermatophilus sp. Leaf369]|uniref:hypothetical protein n=1 Tax=Geodermatophilus sp. Leaf369 TaxID=1736354 RepID=UPI0006FB1FFA|nr:hypothetical protein [Geodermatophilus sp. Leaf369]KQS59938.1 hypothetical protein ASG36_02615 [Geodermatophilus sp. Leaf369]